MTPAVIRLLPDALANQIAAGEVVQRPASVVKELLENALDAGSQRIQLVVQDAGKALIQVIDDGRGMGAADARMSFERHATSKIREADDLFRIGTYGFRGEALASIAAVAQVTLRTRLAAEAVGTQVVVAGGSFAGQESVAAPPGTSVAVRNLFYNVPARRKFLKSNPVETRHILQEFYRVALVHPELRFELVHNGECIYDLWPGTWPQRICQLYPFLTEAELLPAAEDTSLVQVQGFVGAPAVARKSRGEQYFFVNGRFVRDGYLHHAVTQAFGELIGKDSHPVYFLHLTLDPARVDVNIHPTKTEVKFEDERALYALLHSTVRQVLGRLHLQQAAAQQTAGQQAAGAAEMPFALPPAALPPLTLGEFRAQQLAEPAPRPTTPDFGGNGHSSRGGPHGWVPAAPARPLGRTTAADAPAGFVAHRGGALGAPGTPAAPGRAPAGGGPLAGATDFSVLQVLQRYLVVALAEQLLVVDQHAAHQRVLYEQLLAATAHRPLPVQQLLYPQRLNFSAEDLLLLEPALPALRQQGFDVQVIGHGAVLVSGIPPALHHAELPAVFDELLAGLKHGGGEPAAEGGAERSVRDIHHRIARSIARNSAVPAGRRLAPEEAYRLVADLLACAEPAATPSGQPTCFAITAGELAARLARAD